MILAIITYNTIDLVAKQAHVEEVMVVSLRFSIEQKKIVPLLLTHLFVGKARLEMI